jgi:hypothetical protein
VDKWLSGCILSNHHQIQNEIQPRFLISKKLAGAEKQHGQEMLDSGDAGSLARCPKQIELHCHPLLKQMERTKKNRRVGCLSSPAWFVLAGVLLDYGQPILAPCRIMKQASRRPTCLFLRLFFAVPANKAGPVAVELRNGKQGMIEAEPVICLTEQPAPPQVREPGRCSGWARPLN